MWIHSLLIILKINIECINITSIKLPNSVKTLGKYAFYKCSGLASIELSNEIIVIDVYTFFECDNLKNVVMPSSVKQIKEYGYIKNCKGWR